jgi:hypothetical protein
MTVRYVGIGGSDAANGLTWATRKLTLNGAEDTPVVAGDIVYVGPGSYESSSVLLTCDVNGSAGNPITYVGDVTGEHTDGIGGIVRLAATTNNLSGSAVNIIDASKSYRTFRGLAFGGSGDGNAAISILPGGSNIIIEDCYLTQGGTGVYVASFTPDPVLIIRRCIFSGYSVACINFDTGVDVGITALIENCVFSQFLVTNGIAMGAVYGITIKNCTFANCYYCINVNTNPSGGTNSVRNCVFIDNYYPLNAPSGGGTYLTENYNVFDPSNTTARTNVNVGANSTSNWVNHEMPVLIDGQVIGSWLPWRPSRWSDHRRKTGTSEATDDLFGITRPTTSSKNSWGAIQYQEPIRSTTQAYGGTTASLKLEDAGEVQFIVPVTAVSTTISVRAYRETNYAGTNPRMVIRQPGQSDRTTTDAGSATTWNELTDTFTPAALPPYVVVCLQSLNTATSGSYNTYFDAIAVS